MRLSKAFKWKYGVDGVNVLLWLLGASETCNPQDTGSVDILVKLKPNPFRVHVYRPAISPMSA